MTKKGLDRKVVQKTGALPRHCHHGGFRVFLQESGHILHLGKMAFPCSPVFDNVLYPKGSMCTRAGGLACSQDIEHLPKLWVLAPVQTMQVCLVRGKTPRRNVPGAFHAKAAHLEPVAQHSKGHRIVYGSSQLVDVYEVGSSELAELIHYDHIVANQVVGTLSHFSSQGEGLVAGCNSHCTRNFRTNPCCQLRGVDGPKDGQS